MKMENTYDSVLKYFDKYIVEKQPDEELRDKWLDHFSHDDYILFTFAYASQFQAAPQRTVGEEEIELIKEAIAIRNELPDNWKWSKCYELSYTDWRRDYVLKHWALSPPDEKGLVCSLGLISHDNFTETHAKFTQDKAVAWVEKSLKVFDLLRSRQPGIVLPDEKDILEMYPLMGDGEVSHINGERRVAAKWMIQKIKQLNGIK